MDLPPIGKALQAYAAAQLERAGRQLARPGEERHEGIHQARKSIRRARAVLALGGPVLATLPATLRLDRDLRSLCRGLSALRDADARRDGLLQLRRDALLGPIDCKRMIAAVEALRAERLQRALARDPDFTRRRERLAVAVLALDCLPWAELDLPRVEAARATTARRLERARRKALASSDPEDGHRLRRRLRRLRQQETALAAVLPGRDWETPGLGELAERMGAAQDHALLLARCQRAGLFEARDRAMLKRLLEPLYLAAQQHAQDRLLAQSPVLARRR